MRQEPRVKVLAIAKDEAAYIPYWAFHHLRFGFDEIEIITNRTTDNSEEIIKKISRKYPKIKHSNCDWIDLCSPIIRKELQKIAYAKAYEQSKSEGFTHTLFIDIDEFWTPLNFHTTIKEFIEEKNEASISFQWLCELGLEKSFTPIQENGSYYPDPHVKTLINNRAQIDKIRIHTPEFTKNSPHITADGSQYIPDDKEPQKCHPSTVGIKSAVIIHRIFRSEIEYISTLIRGNPESLNSTIKDNRPGFRRSHQNEKTIQFDRELYKKYKSELQVFFNDCGLTTLISAAEETIRNRSVEAIKSIESIINKNPLSARRVLSGIRTPEVVNALNKQETAAFDPKDKKTAKNSLSEAFSNLPSRIKSPMDTGEILREVAFSFEKCHDYQNAYQCMHVASIFRPHGPVIKDKKNFYASKLIEPKEDQKNANIKNENQPHIDSLI